MKIAVCGVIAEACPFFQSLINFLKIKGDEVDYVEPEYSGAVWLIDNKINYLSSSKEKYIKQLFWKTEYDRYIRYDLGLIERLYKNKRQIILNKNNLKEKAVKLLNYYYSFFNRNKIVVLLFWNGLRLNSAVARIAADLLNLRCLYFEKAMFPFYLQIDLEGINYGNSHRKLLTNNLLDETLKPLEYFIELSNEKQYFDDPLSSISTIIKAKYFFKEAKYVDFFKHSLNSFFSFIQSNYLKLHLRKRVEENIDSCRYVFFPLQVTNDTQLICFGNQCISNVEIIKEFSKVLREIDHEIKLVIKQHPLEKSIKEIIGIKKVINELSNCLVSNRSAGELANDSAFTITVNSSVGFEAMLHQKPVIIFGDSLYSDSSLFIKLNSISDIKQNYSKILSFKPDSNEIIKFANTLESMLVKCNFVEPSNIELEAVWNFMKRLLNK